jgi:transposase
MAKKRSEDVEGAPGDAEGAPSFVVGATGASPGGAAPVGPLGPGQRWSQARKREVVLRLLRGESSEALSRELRVEAYRLEQWRDRALLGIDASLRERGETAESVALDAALKRIGEISMENELMRARCRAREANLPLAWRRSGR